MDTIARDRTPPPHPDQDEREARERVALGEAVAILRGKGYLDAHCTAQLAGWAREGEGGASLRPTGRHSVSFVARFAGGEEPRRLIFAGRPGLLRALALCAPEQSCPLARWLALTDLANGQGTLAWHLPPPEDRLPRVAGPM